MAAPWGLFQHMDACEAMFLTRYGTPAHMVPSRAVSVDADWQAMVAPLRRLHEDGKDLRRGREIVALYALAEALAGKVLRKFHQFDEQARQDVVHDVLAAKLVDIVLADKPRSLFVTMLMNRGKDECRRRERHARPTAPEEFDRSEAVSDQDPDFVEEAGLAFSTLSPRDQQILTAVALGDEREDVAARFGIKRPAVDQVFTRARKRLRSRS